jgi:diaminopimelate decarboxylase
MLNPDFLLALREAARAYPTPFYAYDWTAIKKRAEAFREAFPLARPFFALKANPRLGLLRRLKAMGYGAEAVSLGRFCGPTGWAFPRRRWSGTGR